MKETRPPYSIGDYYCEDGKEGVVFWVDNNGFRGKIVHLEYGQSDWLSPNWRLWTEPKERESFLYFQGDAKEGMRNQLRIMSEVGWQKKFPAFAWCASLGPGWYLPAYMEMVQMVKHCDKINNTIRLFHWEDYCLNNDINRYLNSSEGPFAFNMFYIMFEDYYRDPDVPCNYIRAASVFSHLDMLEDEDEWMQSNQTLKNIHL